MKCKTAYCRNKAADRRRYCHKCRSRKYKENHPLKYFYNALRNNARRRGKKFTITFSDWKRLWRRSGKMPGNGYHVDRIDVRKGYEPGNLQILSRYLNVMKWHEEDKFMIDFKYESIPEATSEAPF